MRETPAEAIPFVFSVAKVAAVQAYDPTTFAEPRKELGWVPENEDLLSSSDSADTSSLGSLTDFIGEKDKGGLEEEASDKGGLQGGDDSKRSLEEAES